MRLISRTGSSTVEVWGVNTASKAPTTSMCVSGQLLVADESNSAGKALALTSALVSAATLYRR